MNDKITKTLVQILITITIIMLFMKIQPIIHPILEIIGIIIIPIIIGGFFYYALRPLKKLLLRFIKKDGIASLITILIVLIIIMVITISGGEVIKDQFEDAFIKNQDKLLNYKEYLNGKLHEVLPDLNILEKINNNIKTLVTSIASNATGIFSGVGDFTTQLVLIPFMLFYLLKDDKYFKEKIFLKVPGKYKPEIKDMFKKSDDVLSTYINGQLLVAAIIGSLMFIGYLIIGMPNALLMGSFSLITAVIPILGAFLGILPAILVALTIDFGLVIKIAITAIIVQQLEGNIITPKIMGNKLNLHPLAVIIIIIVSMKLLGLLGAFIGIPLFLVLVIIFKTLFNLIKKRGEK
ncbi:AI-2E family transporter [Desulfonispora thiosulfatigenes]|uniref:AI-2E family transporter n=1 Tax=Desulfonispora thiosulfatigenes TaxID=83661 RepID=UPI000A0383A4|nr:AI-2E family transporter [Desulfonispora thiosulfatigenes]